MPLKMGQSELSSQEQFNSYIERITNSNQQLDRKTILFDYQTTELVRRIIRLAVVGYSMIKGNLR